VVLGRAAPRTARLPVVLPARRDSSRLALVSQVELRQVTSAWTLTTLAIRLL
jgi:hypothetical protein